MNNCIHRELHKKSSLFFPLCFLFFAVYPFLFLRNFVKLYASAEYHTCMYRNYRNFNDMKAKILFGVSVCAELFPALAYLSCSSFFPVYFGLSQVDRCVFDRCIFTLHKRTMINSLGISKIV